jgi:PilZ domain-containing protein
MNFPSLILARLQELFGNLEAVTWVHCKLVGFRLWSQVSMSMKPSERVPKTFRPTLMPASGATRSQTQKRRSTRMALNAPVGLSGQDRQKCPFSLPARATNLNRYGAAVQLHRELQIGSTIVVRNQRGAQVSARIVAQVAAVQGVPTYAIEFVEHDEKAKNFWGITFPTTNS